MKTKEETISKQTNQQTEQKKSCCFRKQDAIKNQNRLVYPVNNNRKYT